MENTKRWIRGNNVTVEKDRQKDIKIERTERNERRERQR
jgi:hypothetical protein